MRIILESKETNAFKRLYAKMVEEWNKNSIGDCKRTGKLDGVDAESIFSTSNSHLDMSLNEIEISLEINNYSATEAATLMWLTMEKLIPLIKKEPYLNGIFDRILSCLGAKWLFEDKIIVTEVEDCPMNLDYLIMLDIRAANHPQLFRLKTDSEDIYELLVTSDKIFLFKNQSLKLYETFPRNEYGKYNIKDTLYILSARGYIRYKPEEEK